MKNIEFYISELVGNHDCVIIPGLGAFIAQPTSADIHPITHKFTAPGRTLGFNAQIKVNDGLLASEISINEGINFQEANTLIDEFVKNISTSLSLYKHYNFSGIGRFFYNIEGKLEFEPDYLVNFSSDSFGLTDIVFKPIERNTYDMNQNTHRKAKEVSSKVTGSGDLVIKGKADSLDCEVTGSGDLDAFGLESANVNSAVTGSGNCKVYCTDFLMARVTGSGDIDYKGDPKKKDTKVHGSGSISKV